MSEIRDIERWSRSESSSERRKALREAEMSHDLRVVPVVVRLLHEDPDSAVKLMAEATARVLVTRLERSLAELRRAQGQPGTLPLGRPLTPSRKRLGSAEPRERRDAVLEMIQHRERHRVDEMLRALEREPEGWVRAEIADALGQLATAEQAGDALLGLLADPVSRVRANTVEALGRLRPEGFEHGVGRLLMDTDRRIRANAVVALGVAESEEARDTLDALLESDDPLDLKAGIFALCALGDEEARERLEALLARSQGEVRATARRALDSWGI